MPLTSSTASPLLAVPTQPQEDPMGDYDHHEGYDPKRRDEETQPPKEDKPEEKPAPKKTPGDKA